MNGRQQRKKERKKFNISISNSYIIYLLLGKVYQNKVCDICGFNGKVIESFGVKYCKECYDKKPKRGNGNSGMIKMSELAIQGSLFAKEGLYLEKTTKGNKEYATIYLEHYPGSLGIVGRQLNYFIKDGIVTIGIIGCNSPPLNYKLFNNYFGADYTELNWVNNNVFRLLRHTPNLGTRVLKIFRKQILDDYKNIYGDSLVGIVTFVEPPRTGAVYKADNWDFLGETQGKKCQRRGDHGKWVNKEWSTGTKKLVFAKWLIPLK